MDKLTEKAKIEFSKWFYNNYTNVNNYEHIRQSELERFSMLYDFVQYAFIIKWMNDELDLWAKNFKNSDDWNSSIIKTILIINKKINVK